MVNFKDVFYRLPSSIQRRAGPYIRRALYPGIYWEQKRRHETYNDLSVKEKKFWIFEKVKALAVHAQKNNKFYYDFYESHGFDSHSLKSYEDLQRIPVVNKDILRSARDDWFPAGRRGFRGNTGGTSGSPLSFAFDRVQLVKESYYISRIWQQLGFSERSTRLVFRGLSHLGGRAWMYHPESDAYLINVYKPLNEIAGGVSELLKTQKIDFLHGYPSAIYQFAKACREDEHSEILVNLRKNLKGVLLGSEYPAPVYRDAIASTFEVPTVSWYGHSEMAVLAAEQSEPFVYRPFNSYGWCEAVKDKDDEYHLVGTCYDNFVTPFIRYDTGDSIEVVCDSDRLLESFTIANGRIGDYVYDRTNHPVSLTAFVFGRHHRAFDIADFVQISQNQPGTATLHLTCRGLADDANLSELFDLKNIDIQFALQKRATPYRTSLGKTPLLIPHTESLP